MNKNVRNCWCQKFKSTSDVSDTTAFVWTELHGKEIFIPAGAAYYLYYHLPTLPQ